MSIAVSRLSIIIGVDAKGNMVNQLHVATPDKTLHVEPGKHATIRSTAGGRVRIAEVPLGALGWEYDPLPE